MIAAAGWIVVTIAAYLASRALHRRLPLALLSPVLVAPALLAALLVLFGVPYPAYHRGGAFLVDLLGPTTVAFAVPLWRHRALLRRHARELTLAVLAGSAVAVSTSVALARALGLSRVVVRSLATRSITTPFAMIVADMVGGAPALAAVFVIVTGVLGVAIAQGILRLLPLRSAVARGALFGMGAHGVGTARAMELGHVEGTVSGLVMILAGLTGLATAPIVRLALGP